MANEHRLLKDQAPTYKVMQNHEARYGRNQRMDHNVSINCGWGRLIMGHTFEDPEKLSRELLKEKPGERDIALYVANPHVVLAYEPQMLFLDPSDTYRLELSIYKPQAGQQNGVEISRAINIDDAKAINKIYLQNGMVDTDINYIVSNKTSKTIVFLVARDSSTGDVIGTVSGINHLELFADPTSGSSLWCLAVDPFASRPGVGEALVRYLAEYFQARKCSYMDLSVMHNNSQAKALYEKLGFTRLQTFAIKRKNAHNTKLFIGQELEEDLNPYAKIITDEARSRGIKVDVIDAENGFFELKYGGTRIKCRESLSEMTSALAMSICQDKQVTQRLLEKNGIETPAFCLAKGNQADEEFLKQYQTVVVKPANGEQGKGVSVGVTSSEELKKSIDQAKRLSEKVLIEECVTGQDVRIVVIGNEVVAASVRKPPTIRGNGILTVKQLIERLNRRRMKATDGESSVPFDSETERCLLESGYQFSSVLEKGKLLKVRKAANLHTGGTIHDVTHKLHPGIRDVALKTARVLDIPVVGLDFIMPDVKGEVYRCIEANERVGLANHEPQPTAEKFVDLLFPMTRNANKSDQL